MSDGLFDDAPYRLPVAAIAASTRAGHRTLGQRQAAKLARKLHPLSNTACVADLRLHPDAAPADDRDAPGLRCGSCRFRQSVNTTYNGPSYPKCVYTSDPDSPNRYSRAPRFSYSEATDVRAWWPACRDHEADEGES